MHNAYLRILVDGLEQRFPLQADSVCRLGRGDHNSIVLNGDKVSRNHAMVQAQDDGTFALYDLGSRNGTFLNERRVVIPQPLKDGDVISVGGHEIRFEQTVEAVTQKDESPARTVETVALMAFQLITVLVVDIRDFTGLSTRIDASHLAQLAGALFREAGEILDRRGAWSQKYIGDAVMAIFVHKDINDTSRLYDAFDALLEIVTVADSLQSRFDLAQPIRVGAGINTGFASLGNVGSGAQSDYTAMGDTVNKAFRIESTTKVLKRDLIIGSQSQLLLTDPRAVETFTEHHVELKGYTVKERVYSAEFEAVALFRRSRSSEAAS